MTTKKPLASFVLGPTGKGFFGIPTVFYFGKKPWTGGSVEVNNRSNKALRITVEDITPEWNKTEEEMKEKKEREQLVALQKKYARR